MYLRSKLSLEKDECNYAFMLADDLVELAALECIKLTPKQRLDILYISLRLSNRGIAYAKDLREVEGVLGRAKTCRLKQNAIFKARLETDLVNSE